MTGKTQIAKELSRRIGVPYFKASNERVTFLKAGWGHASASEEVALESSLNVLRRKIDRVKEIESNRFLYDLLIADPRMVDFMKQTGQSVVMDRGFPCERVYAEVMNRETDQLVLQQIDEAYNELGTKIVICVRNCYDGIVDDIDVRIDASVLCQLDERYRNLHNTLACQTMLLRVDDEHGRDRTLDDEMSEILPFLGLE